MFLLFFLQQRFRCSPRLARNCLQPRQPHVPAREFLACEHLLLTKRDVSVALLQAIESKPLNQRTKEAWLSTAPFLTCIEHIIALSWILYLKATTVSLHCVCGGHLLATISRLHAGIDTLFEFKQSQRRLVNEGSCTRYTTAIACRCSAPESLLLVPFLTRSGWIPCGSVPANECAMMTGHDRARTVDRGLSTHLVANNLSKSVNSVILAFS